MTKGKSRSIVEVEQRERRWKDEERFEEGFDRCFLDRFCRVVLENEVLEKEDRNVGRERGMEVLEGKRRKEEEQKVLVE